jgi:hypothetical protein
VLAYLGSCLGVTASFVWPARFWGGPEGVTVGGAQELLWAQLCWLRVAEDGGLIGGRSECLVSGVTERSKRVGLLTPALYGGTAHVLQPHTCLWQWRDRAVRLIGV